MLKNTIVFLISLIILVVSSQSCTSQTRFTPVADTSVMTAISFPEPQDTSVMSLEQSLAQRRSVRNYSSEPVSLQALSQLLWAAQGITNAEGHRTAPSAGGLYPLELYVVAGNVTGLEQGIYHYRALSHSIVPLVMGDKREECSKASLGQQWVKDAALTIIITGVYERTTEKYGDRGIRYVHMEAGHASQNICLQAVTLNLGTVTVGAFHDEDMKSFLHLPVNEAPLYVMPVGKPSDG